MFGARRFFVALLCSVPWLCSCTAPSSAVPLQVPLEATDGASSEVSAIVAQNRFSVFIFDSEGCPTMEAHHARIAHLAKKFGPEGVDFYLIDSEPRVEGGRAPHPPVLEAMTRYTDSSARLARALGVQFATHAVVFDASGNVVYSGALDSDRVILHDDARMYLAESLDELLAGRRPRHGSPEPLGCVLQLR